MLEEHLKVDKSLEEYQVVLEVPVTLVVLRKQRMAVSILSTVLNQIIIERNLVQILSFC